MEYPRFSPKNIKLLCLFSPILCSGVLLHLLCYLRGLPDAVGHADASLEVACHD